MSTFAFASVPTSLDLKEVPREAAASTAAGGPPPLPPLGGSMQFSVQNTNTRFARVGRFGVAPGGGAQAAWLSFKEAPPTSPGQFELEFEKGATRTVTLQVTVPPEAQPGSYHFNVQVVSTEDTDNDVAASPAVSFTVPQRAVPVVPPKPAFPWWAVAAGAAFLLVAGGGAWWAFSGDDMVEVPGVVGKDFATAVIQLNEAGLKPVPAGLMVSSQPPGVVAASKPAAGAKVPKNGQVELTLASPPNTPDPCIRRDLATNLMIFCNRAPITPNAVRNPAFNAALLDAIKPRTP